jgi:hypothetical protein
MACELELMATIARDLAPWSSVKFTRYTASSGSLARMPVSDWPAARDTSNSVTGRQPTARSAALLCRQAGFFACQAGTSPEDALGLVQPPTLRSPTGG